MKAEEEIAEWRTGSYLETEENHETYLPVYLVARKLFLPHKI
jgi:hypothetical protein